MARLSNTYYPVPHYEDFTDDRDGIKAYFEAQDDAFDKLDAESSSLPEGVLYDPKTGAGYLAMFPVADGKAIYRVVKVSPLTLQHIPIGDAYQIPDAHLRGLREADLLALQRNDKFWQSLRGGRK